jgi:putative redox protein
MPYEAEIRTFGDGVVAAIDPGSIVVKHHRAGVAEVKVERLTGGHLLHLALAGCVFNNVLRMARKRGISLRDASVRVQGEFTADGDSTGIECTVSISSDADAEHVRALAREAFDDSTVGSVLKRATKVELIEA